jgi:hypothetical protein
MSFERGDHGLVVVKCQFVRSGLLHPHNIAGAEACLTDQLADLRSGEWINDVIDA